MARFKKIASQHPLNYNYSDEREKNWIFKYTAIYAYVARQKRGLQFWVKKRAPSYRRGAIFFPFFLTICFLECLGENIHLERSTNY